MNVACLTHRQVGQDCMACGLAELSRMTRPASAQPDGCPVAACQRPPRPGYAECWSHARTGAT